MPKKGENIYKRKDGRWEGRYVRERDPLTDKARYGYVYAATYNECKHLKALAEAGLKAAVETDRTMTVSACLDLWLEEKRAEPHLHESTLQQYERHIRQHIKPALGGARVCRLTWEELNRFRLRQLNHGRLDGMGGLSSSVVNTQMVILQSMLEMALRRKVIAALPERPAKKQAAPRQERETRVLEVWEQDRIETLLAGALEGQEQERRGLCLGVFFALYTGLRVGELGGLQWRDIDLATMKVTVRRTLQRIGAPEGEACKTRLTLGPAKTRQSRRANPLNRAVGGLLREYYESLPPSRRGLGEYVFTYRGGCVEPRLFQQFFKRLAAQAGIAPANFHALRHTFATRCLERGVDFQTLSELLGHSDATITAKRYAHSMPQHKAECLERLTCFFPAALCREEAVSRRVM